MYVWHKNISMAQMNARTLEILNDLHGYCGILYSNLDLLNKLRFKNKKINDKIEKCLYLVAVSFSDLNDYLDWYHEVDVQYTQQNDRETKLLTELENAKLENEKLTIELNNLQRKNEALLTALKKRNTDDTLKNFNILSSQLLDLVDRNVKNIAFGERIKNSKTFGSVTYIKDLDTDLLVKDYIAAGYKLTKELFKKYNDKYGITYHGLRLRLINAGVWKANR